MAKKAEKPDKADKKEKKADKPDQDDKTEKADPDSLPLAEALIRWADNPKKVPATDAWETDDWKKWLAECDRLCDLLNDDPRIERQKEKLIEFLDMEGDEKRSDDNIQDIKNKLRTIMKSLHV
jgi:hypothetical protein